MSKVFKNLLCVILSILLLSIYLFIHPNNSIIAKAGGVETTLDYSANLTVRHTGQYEGVQVYFNSSELPQMKITSVTSSKNIFYNLGYSSPYSYGRYIYFNTKKPGKTKIFVTFSAEGLPDVVKTINLNVVKFGITSPFSKLMIGNKNIASDKDGDDFYNIPNIIKLNKSKKIKAIMKKGWKLDSIRVYKSNQEDYTNGLEYVKVKNGGKLKATKIRNHSIQIKVKNTSKKYSVEYYIGYY